MSAAESKFEWLLRQETGTLAEQSLLQAFVIACHHKRTTVDGGREFPPYHVWLAPAQIAQRTGMHERTIPAVARSLQRRGLIELAGRHGRTGQIKVYRLLIEEAERPKESSLSTTTDRPKEPSLFGDERPQDSASKDRRFLHQRPKDPASAYIDLNQQLNQQVDNVREMRAPSRGRKRSDKQTFQAWYEAAKAISPKVLPEDDPIHAYMTKVGMNYEFLLLHWHWFKAKHLLDSQKLQADWPRTFRNSVRGNFGNLWWRTSEGAWKLTTAGKQAALEHDCDENMASGGGGVRGGSEA